MSPFKVISPLSVTVTAEFVKDGSRVVARLRIILQADRSLLIIETGKCHDECGKAA